MPRPKPSDASEPPAAPAEPADKLAPDPNKPPLADAYAQTVAFALLLGRSIGADPLTLQNTQDALSTRHNLLSRALQVLTDPQARTPAP